MAVVPVVIAGGGPAGIATALSLRRRGVECLVIDAAIPVPYKPGETIAPNAHRVFEKLGISALLQASDHLPSYGNRFVWGHEQPADRSFFNATPANGWHLDRPHFELQLCRHLEAEGGTLLKARITDFSCKARHWEISVEDHNGDKKSISCQFLADATGRARRLTRALGIPRIRLDALTAVWMVVEPCGEAAPHYTFIEAVADGWWYAAPLPQGRLSLGFFSDADLPGKALLDGDRLLEKAAATIMMGGLVKNAIVQYPPQMRPAFTSYTKHRFTASWLAVGDAAFSYDPISSYGIVSALEGGYYAGHAIADHLAGKEDALAVYDALISNAFKTCDTMRLSQYEAEKRWPDALFWKRRARTAFLN